MFYSDDLIEEVRIQNDIVGVISSYIKLQRRGDNYVGLCPFHNEKTPSFTVSASKQIYHCFGCGVGGTVITFVMEYENYNFPEAIKWLADRVGMRLPKMDASQSDRIKSERRNRLLEINKLAARYYYYLLRSERGKEGYRYLKGRGLEEEVIHQFGLGFADGVKNDLYAYIKSKAFDDEEIKKSGLVKVDEKKGVRDKFYGRIMFPIMDVNSRVIGFGGRVMGNGTPKYLNSPETEVFNKSRNLYGLNYARKSREGYILLCEGYMDVISLHQAGFTNAVAALGTAFTGLQANLLKRYTDGVYLMFDGDEAGTKAAIRAIPILREAGVSAKVVHLEPYKDPDEFIQNLGREELGKRIEDAENGFYFELSVLQKGYDLTDPEQKTRFFNEVAKKLLVFTEEIERNNYIEAVARLYQIRQEDLRKLVNRFGIKQVEMTRSSTPRRGENDLFKDANPEWEDKEGGVAEKRRGNGDGLHKSQKLLISWLSDDASLYGRIKDYIDPEDFKEEPYRQVLTLAYEQIKEEGSVTPAKIIHHFNSKEEQSYVASIFNEKLEGELSKGDKEKALNDIVKKIKRLSVEYEIRRTTDKKKLQNLIIEQTKLQKLHISL